MSGKERERIPFKKKLWVERQTGREEALYHIVNGQQSTDSVGTSSRRLPATSKKDVRKRKVIKFVEMLQGSKTSSSVSQPELPPPILYRHRILGFGQHNKVRSKGCRSCSNILSITPPHASWDKHWESISLSTQQSTDPPTHWRYLLIFIRTTYVYRS